MGMSKGKQTASRWSYDSPFMAGRYALQESLFFFKEPTMIHKKSFFHPSRFQVQPTRTTKWFSWEWEPDQVDDSMPMICALTVFGYSFVWLGTAL